ncbi:MAG: dihydrodipicolinate synthase family protein [Planctomycetota bacterium]|mgnify:CR=1 FL=1|nr:MAG: dihydrodipicolinate synthase family protein [Planctomycetota bacterium]REJ98650.1 MAG: dihydrodipicolinate synthase family protein [Planctomycetota bacterium]REK20446.1 MAG: dihydrodipicolinate synthase family protein [Planctomycetota bacterium]REK29261.1 MAG: dihydrodipicolinate synthase family protein [Planctomycetota bacterium]
MHKQFHGVWPAMITPLDEAGRPNHEAVEQLVELFISQQLGGLYILGSTGQWPLLPPEHRRSVAERVVQTAAGRIPVIVHVGAAATEDAVELARHAESIGADAVSAVAPIYYPATVDDLFHHYHAIGEASRLPLFVYHLSTVQQVSIDPPEYARRVLEVPNIAGMKVTDRDLFPLGVIAAIAGDRLRLFSGADSLICHAALSGACGAIGTFFNLYGAPAKRARAAFVAGDFQAGLRFMSAFQSALAEVLASGSIWSFLRTAMRLRFHIETGMPRPPLGATDQPWEEADVHRLVQQVESAAE